MFKSSALPWSVRIHLFLFFASILWIVVPAVNKTPSAAIKQNSIIAAKEFLYLVDTEEYAKSWEVTSDLLKDLLDKSSWHEQITKIRSFLGPIIERMQPDITYTDSASDVPQGEYVVMTFVSRFELRERVIETLTLMLSENEEWQVVGYFLH
jgi:aspartokinase-like uncharacterized kinase